MAQSERFWLLLSELASSAPSGRYLPDTVRAEPTLKWSGTTP